jgi:chromosome segregation ATPase
MCLHVHNRHREHIEGDIMEPGLIVAIIAFLTSIAGITLSWLLGLRKESASVNLTHYETLQSNFMTLDSLIKTLRRELEEEVKARKELEDQLEEETLARMRLESELKHEREKIIQLTSRITALEVERDTLKTENRKLRDKINDLNRNLAD